MENFRRIGYLCVALVLFFEIGRVLGNIVNGESAFYLFNWSERFSFENRFFFIYWGYLVGCYFIIKDVFFDGKSLDNLFNTSTESSNYNSSSNRYENKNVLGDIPNSDDPIFRIFLKEKNISYLECEQKWHGYWKKTYENWKAGRKVVKREINKY